MTKLIKPSRENYHKLKPSFYWAYGSNLSKANMKKRCPEAKPVKPFILGQLELTFRGVADVKVSRDESHITPGALWRITRKCEEALDQFEGVAQGRYIKRYFQIVHGGKKRVVLFYQMRMKHGVLPPTEEYYNKIAQGYLDFNLPIGFLEEALGKSWDNKSWTPELRRRWRDRGQPTMMREAAR
jgi:hypothetical protein